MRLKNHFLIVYIFLIGFVYPVKSQQALFPPLNIPLESGGSFAEPRLNHFHSGIDLKTQGREGLPVFCAENGEIVRIKISPYGYGKALYINHPGGITTVYGHLSSFSSTIDSLSRIQQYAQRKNEIDWHPPSGSLQVKRGDQIALSGNSGGSGGPHLHFEIRETASEKPVDPLEFGLMIQDNEFPIIKSIYIYPMSNGSQAEGNMKPFLIPVTGNNGIYKTELPSPFRISGTIGFGIECFDPQKNSDGKNGVRSIDLQLYDRSIFYADFGKFSFEETRFSNAQTDYSKRIKEKKIIHRMYVLPGDGFSGYKHLFNRGIINSIPGNVYKFKCVVKDGSGNTSTLDFDCVGIEPLQWETKELECESGIKLIPGVKNSLSFEGISLSFGPNTIYDTTGICLIPVVKNASSNFEFIIGQDNIPVHQSYTLSLDLKKLDIPFSNKLCVFRRSDSGELLFESNKVNEKEITASLRSFGRFILMKDEQSPLITLLKNKTHSFKISDGLSGIDDYTLIINGAWHRAYFDAKKGILLPDLSSFKNGETLSYELKVSDKAGNLNSLSGKFQN